MLDLRSGFIILSTVMAFVSVPVWVYLTARAPRIAPIFLLVFVALIPLAAVTLALSVPGLGIDSQFSRYLGRAIAEPNLENIRGIFGVFQGAWLSVAGALLLVAGFAFKGPYAATIVNFANILSLLGVTLNAAIFLLLVSF